MECRVFNTNSHMQMIDSQTLNLALLEWQHRCWPGCIFTSSQQNPRCHLKGQRVHLATHNWSTGADASEWEGKVGLWHSCLCHFSASATFATFATFLPLNLLPLQLHLLLLPLLPLLLLLPLLPFLPVPTCSNVAAICRPICFRQLRKKGVQKGENEM